VVYALASEFTSGLAVNLSWSRHDLQYCDVPALLRCYDDGLEVLDEMLDMTRPASLGEKDVE
jgi:hypothetical protein